MLVRSYSTLTARTGTSRSRSSRSPARPATRTSGAHADQARRGPARAVDYACSRPPPAGRSSTSRWTASAWSPRTAARLTTRSAGRHRRADQGARERTPPRAPRHTRGAQAVIRRRRRAHRGGPAVLRDRPGRARGRRALLRWLPERSGRLLRHHRSRLLRRGPAARVAPPGGAQGNVLSFAISRPISWRSPSSTGSQPGPVPEGAPPRRVSVGCLPRVPYPCARSVRASKRYGGVRALDGVSLDERGRRVLRPARAQRRRQDHADLHPRRARARRCGQPRGDGPRRARATTALRGARSASCRRSSSSIPSSRCARRCASSRATSACGATTPGSTSCSSAST